MSRVFDDGSGADLSVFNGDVDRRYYDLTVEGDVENACSIVSSLASLNRRSSRVEYLGAGFVSLYVNSAVLHYRWDVLPGVGVFVLDQVLETVD